MIRIESSPDVVFVYCSSAKREFSVFEPVFSFSWLSFCFLLPVLVFKFSIRIREVILVLSKLEEIE